MPFKSKAQMRWMFAAERRGEVPKGTARRWAHETPNLKSLPEKKSDGKKSRVKKSEFYKKYASLLEPLLNQASEVVSDALTAVATDDELRKELIKGAIVGSILGGAFNAIQGNSLLGGALTGAALGIGYSALPESMKF